MGAMIEIPGRSVTALVVVSLAVLTALLLPIGSGGSVGRGVLTGAVYLAGGPVDTSTGGSVCQGRRCPGAGQVTVRTLVGEIVRRARLKRGQHFRFYLVAGTYRLTSGRLCTRKTVRVVARQTKHANVICAIQ